MTTLAGAFAWLLDLTFPKYCAGCGREGVYCCEECHKSLLFSAPSCPVCSRRNFNGVLCDPCSQRMHLRRFLAPFSYREPLVRELIHYYKYVGVRDIASIFADEIVAFLGFYGIRPQEPAVLVPIPLHRSRERKRGFNQARLLAEALAERLKLPVADALRRIRATAPQVGMDSFEERRTNVTDAFSVNEPAAIAGSTVILIDDVSTSGATLSEAARALREANCRTVWAIVIAKG